jgi:hypothetical protein
LTSKAAKIHLDEFKTVVRNNYLLSKDIFDFQNTMQAGQKQQQEKVLELEEIIKQQTKTI